MNNKDITHGTDNVFADLGFAGATERQTKTQLAITITNTSIKLSLSKLIEKFLMFL